ncbi:hypothetical protein LXL04_013459 [Taraxacum kok-saghyz]
MDCERNGKLEISVDYKKDRERGGTLKAISPGDMAKPAPMDSKAPLPRGVLCPNFGIETSPIPSIKTNATLRRGIFELTILVSGISLSSRSRCNNEKLTVDNLYDAVYLQSMNKLRSRNLQDKIGRKGPKSDIWTPNHPFLESSCEPDSKNMLTERVEELKNKKMTSPRETENGESPLFDAPFRPFSAFISITHNDILSPRHIEQLQPTVEARWWLEITQEISVESNSEGRAKHGPVSIRSGELQAPTHYRHLNCSLNCFMQLFSLPYLTFHFMVTYIHIAIIGSFTLPSSAQSHCHYRLIHIAIIGSFTLPLSAHSHCLYRLIDIAIIGSLTLPLSAH